MIIIIIKNKNNIDIILTLIVIDVIIQTILYNYLRIDVVNIKCRIGIIGIIRDD